MSGLNKFPESGGVISDATTRINDNNGVVLRQCGLNLIRQLEDRSVILSADGGEWAEVYSDGDGTLSSVDFVNTTANMDVENKKITSNLDLVIAGITTSSGDIEDITNMFNKSIQNFTRINTTGSYVGKTFDSQNVIKIKTYVGRSATGTTECFIQTYNGSTWTTVATLNPGTTPGWTSVDVNSSIQGVRLLSNDNDDIHAYVLEIVGDSAEVLIYHNIPSGSFSSTISNCVGIPKFVNWESGSNIQYKLTNATEDTGWLNPNEIVEFTAFTSEPTKCIVKLIPKTSSPTSGYPSISGFALLANKLS